MKGAPGLDFQTWETVNLTYKGAGILLALLTHC
jgi:hypothetical protein